MKHAFNFFLCITAMLVLFNACTSPASEDKLFDVAELTGEWVALTESDSGMIVFNPCDAANMSMTIFKTDSTYLMEIEEGHEGMRAIISSATVNKGDTVTLKVNVLDWEAQYTYQFKWTDKSKGLANWISIFGENSKYISTIVSGEFADNYPVVEQPCEECWEEDDCAHWATDAAIKDIKRIFTEYTQSGESVDSKEDKKLMVSSLNKIKIAPDSTEYRLILDVWMYYDPTDFDDEANISRILMIDRAKSVAAILTRMAHKEDWESPEHAPLSDLDDLSKRLEVD